MKGALYAITFVSLLVIGCSPEAEEQLEAIRLGEEAAIQATGSSVTPDYNRWTVVKNVQLPVAQHAQQAIRNVPTYSAVKRELTRAELDSVAIELFFNLGNLTDGQAYSASNALSVISTVTTIIHKHAEHGSDIVLLIDKTGSMTDDISSLRTNLHYIINVLQHIPNVRLGIAFYADRNFDATWFDLFPLTTEFNEIRNALNHIRPVGGGDVPESVNDGIYEALHGMNWSSENKRMLLVLGDAPSLTASRSDHNLDDVVAECQAGGVKVNLYPVLINVTSGNSNFMLKDGTWVINSENPTPEPVKPSGMITSIYPNPAVDVAILQLATWGDYRIEMYTITGSLVLDVAFTGDTYHIDCAKLPAGQYVIRASSPVSKLFDGKNLIVQH